MPDAPIEYGIQPPEDLFELGASVRRLVDRMMVVDRAHDELVKARAEVNAIASRLEAIGRRNLKARMSPQTDPEPDDLRPYFAGNARRWHYNPMFPPLELENVAGTLRGRVTLGLQYEGPPGCVHGGLVALLLDQILGQSNFESGVPAMTGTLKVRYRRPTPLLEELTIEGDGPTFSDGRKCQTRGRILCRGEVTAEATGLFVVPAGVELPMMYGSLKSQVEGAK